MRRHTPFARNADGQLVSIADVPSGLACRCNCASCGERLIARKGKIRHHHFAHESGSECAAAYETAIHLAVKEVLERQKRILLPACYAWHRRIDDEIDVSYPLYDPRDSFRDDDSFDFHYGTTGVGALPARLLSFDRVVLEQPVGNVRPDLIGYWQDIPLFMEVAVTRFVDAEKLGKLRALGVSSIELDFSEHRLWTWESIEHQLLKATEQKKWLTNRVADQLADKDRLQREKRTEEARNHQDKPVTHKSEFPAKFGPPIRVFLCPGFVGVQAVAPFFQYRLEDVPQAFHAMMESGGGTYDTRTHVWQFRPPSEDQFIYIENAVRQAFKDPYRAGASLMLPPDRQKFLRELMDW